MNRRRRLVSLLKLVLLMTGLTGRQLSAAPATEIVVRMHWLGLDRIAADTNSVRFMSVWRLPQTTALVTQTLDKLSRWPGHGVTNAASTLLRPLLDDLISSESYLEVRAPTNSSAYASGYGATALKRSESGQPLGASERSEDGSTPSARRSKAKTAQLSFTLALRLPADRARLWQTNLAAAIETLTGVRPLSGGDGWVLRQTNAPARIEFSRSHEWTLVGLGLDTNILQSDFAARIARDHAPATTNFWLEADLDPSAILSLSAADGGEGQTPRPQERERVAEGRVRVKGKTPFDAGEVALKTNFTHHSSLSRLHLTLTGEAGNVLTRGTLDFSRPLDLPLSPWAIPTNLIHEPLASFTAARGLAPRLAALPAWRKLELAPPPDQAYLWAPLGGLFQTDFAAPLPAAGNQLRQLAGRLVQSANPWLATNGEGNFQWQTNPPDLLWKNALILAPFLKPIIVNRQDYVLGGLIPFAEGNTNPPPAEILRAVLDTTNLVYYQFEQTGLRIEDDLFIIQLFRVIFHKPELPPVAGLWLKNLEPVLGDSTTLVTQTGAEQLSSTRLSTIGLTALELHLLADWLESPRFPRGLHTFSAP